MIPLFLRGVKGLLPQRVIMTGGVGSILAHIDSLSLPMVVTPEELDILTANPTRTRGSLLNSPPELNIVIIGTLRTSHLNALFICEAIFAFAVPLSGFGTRRLGGLLLP